jgi:hypothetical protein
MSEVVEPERAARFEVRPSRGANAVKLIVLCGLMTAASGFALAAGDDLVTRACGALGVAFFGGGGVYGIWTMARTPWTLAFTPDALEIRFDKHVARAPWADIEAVGMAHLHGQRMPSIRLSRYDRYFASHSPAAMAAFLRRMGAMKWAARATFAATLEASLVDHARAHSAADYLRANRALTGYDISFSWAQLDRPAKRFAALLEQEWRSRR